MALSPVESICPACGKNPIDEDDDETGFCSSCSDNYAVEAYWEKDRPIVEARRDDWRARTSSAAALRERQHRHRLLTNTRPRERPHPNSDPLELCWEALEHLRRLRPALKSNGLAREHLDDACELVKQLAVGPEQERSRTDA